VLTKAAAYDRRTIGRAEVMAWYEALGDVDLADALEAVADHYAESTDWLMPAHVRRLTAEIGRERARAVAAETEALAIEAECERTDLRPLRDRSPEIQAFVRRVRDVLPAGDPDALRWGHRYWRQVHEREERAKRAEPNPHYDPTALARLAEMVADEPRSRATTRRST